MSALTARRQAEHRNLKRQVLALLRERPTGSTTNAIVELTGRPKSTIHSAIGSLESDGDVVIVSERSGAGGLLRSRILHVDHATPEQRRAPRPRVKLAATDPKPSAPRVDPERATVLSDRDRLLIEARDLLFSAPVVQLLLPAITVEQLEVVVLRAGVDAIRGMVKR